MNFICCPLALISFSMAFNCMSNLLFTAFEIDSSAVWTRLASLSWMALNSSSDVFLKASINRFVSCDTTSISLLSLKFYDSNNYQCFFIVLSRLSISSLCLAISLFNREIAVTFLVISASTSLNLPTLSYLFTTILFSITLKLSSNLSAKGLTCFSLKLSNLLFHTCSFNLAFNSLLSLFIDEFSWAIWSVCAIPRL